MTTNESSILDQDYSEAMIRIQQLHKQLQKEMREEKYAAARNTSRKIAVDAMLIGIWCRKFVDRQAGDDLPF
jgi:meiotically up-regulated gene 157 (Mug157) protein